MDSSEKVVKALRAALKETERLRQQNRDLLAAANEPIAIVSLACRLPGGVETPEQVWQLLAESRDAISELPSNRGWPTAELYDPDPDRVGTYYARGGGFLTAPELFDAGFFGISPREAQAMDPQQRILLELAWEAIERAGIAPARLQGSDTGVFVGTCYDDYQTLGPSAREAHDGYKALGCAPSIVSGRIAYVLGLEGPALSLDTACSTSLVATHIACQALRRRECSLALCGGVTVFATLDPFLAFSRLRALSPDGRCRAFSEQANGAGWSEGAGMLVLERLSDAQANGHPILATIVGSAINQDGRSQGLTAPNGPSQQRVIWSALASAKLGPDDVDVVEAHGTGTRLGDPIEVQALQATYGSGRSPGHPLLLGSIKSNIGHAQAAAGVIGLIKMVLALQHQRLPKTLHAEQLSSYIDWSAGDVEVLQAPVAWPRSDRPRRAAVSSFGISGTNAHVIIEEPPSREQSILQPPSGPVALLVSGKSDAALRAQAKQLHAFLAAHPSVPAPQVAHALATARTHLDHRACVVANDHDALLDGLSAIFDNRPAPHIASGIAKAEGRLTFVFPGQGAQWAEMARALLDESEVFRAKIEACAEALAPHTDWSLLSLLRGELDAAMLERVDVVQPALWAMMVALAEQWRALGVVPDAVVGHSQGEIAAATVAGILSLQDGAKVVALRSRAITALSGRGAMAAVSLPVAELRRYIEPFGERLAIAVDNGPESTVVSGEPRAVESLIHELEQHGVFARKVRVDYASHCADVESIRDDILGVLAGIEPRRPEIAMVSTVTGKPLEAELLDGDYWYRNLRQTVRFAEAGEFLLDQGHRFFVEVSPHPLMPVALAGLIEAKGHTAAVVGTLRRNEGGLQRALLSLAELHCQGYDLDWAAYFGSYQPPYLPLPTYPFQRQRFWLDQPQITAAAHSTHRHIVGGHPLLGRQFRVSTLPDLLLWEQTLTSDEPAYLTDHRVEAACLFPGAGFVELALSAARQASGAVSLTVEQLELRRPLVLQPDQPTSIQVATTDSGSSSWMLSISEAHGGEWQQLSCARVSVTREAPASTVTLAGLREQHCNSFAATELYAKATRAGLDYGPAFRGIESLWLTPAGDSVLARVVLPSAAGSASDYMIHPALLDACFQVALAALLDDSDRGPSVPVLIDRMCVYRPVGSGPVWVAATTRELDDPGHYVIGLRLWDEQGDPLALVDGLHVAPVEGSSSAVDPLARALLEVCWREHEPAQPNSSGRWLVLADRRGAAQRLRPHLEAHGVMVEIVDGLDPLDVGAIERQLDTALRAPLAGIICPWSLDVPDLETAAANSVVDVAQVGCIGVLNLVKSLASRPLRDPPRLVLVTERAQAPRGPASVRPDQALVWGLGSTIRSEHASYRPLRIDLDDITSDIELATLARVALSDTDEDQLAVRHETCFVARLERATLPPPARHRSQPASDHAYRLEIEAPGSLDSLHLVAIDRREPGPGEVEIAIEAAGVNFLDLLSALGEIPPVTDGSVDLGGECSGRIVRVGSEVHDLQVGQRVVAIAPHSFATHTTTAATLVLPIPEELDFAEAATLPIVHLTTYFALHETARLREGERVLIHSAAGGIGISAIQWAQHVGAEIYATAGTPDKREWLRAQGIEHVSDSRSDQFVDDIRRWTNGEGVDVVLNSLSGPLLAKSFGLLRTGGRFVEIGKRDYIANKPLRLAPFLKGLSFTLVDLATMIARAPQRVRELFEQVLMHVREGHYAPLPVTASPLSAAADIFWRMGRGHHIGKFVLTLAEPETPLVDVPVGSHSGAISQQASYLITGGLGGLGLSLANWMSEQGAGHIVLVGRRGVTRDEQRVAIAEIEARGTRVTVVSGDVTRRHDLAAAFAAVPCELPLRGIVHAAGTLDDGLLINQTLDKFDRVLAPKIAGAWNLHLLSKELELDFFVLYSSAASVLGPPGQGNYAAANAFVDALARYRQRLGLPALAVSWGPFSDVGLAAADELRGARLSNRGIRALSPSEGLELFEKLSKASTPHVVPCPIDVHQWVEFFPQSADWPFLEELFRSAPSALASGADELLATLRALPVAAAREQLVELVLQQLAKVVRVDALQLDPRSPFADLGVDSLMGIELRNLLKATAGTELPSTAIWTYPTPNALAEYLYSRLIGDLGNTPSSSARSDAEPVEKELLLPQAELTDDSLLDELRELEGILDV